MIRALGSAMLALVAVGLLAGLGMPATPSNGRIDQFIVPRPPAPGGGGGGSNPIAAVRLPAGDTSLPNGVWSSAGVEGGIPTTRTRCTTGTGTSVISAGASLTATINTAISGC